MAKRREDRYNNVEELLMDLEALRQGHPPIQAHKRFDVSMLEQLETGDTVEAEESADTDEIITRYRLYLLILGAVSFFAILIIIAMLVL